jgi:sec-independent protein translocase protein TatC|tara:strand:+ start:1404 stop:2099 length:696 start_codon:yes stop_codon:yes gene_type:complete
VSKKPFFDHFKELNIRILFSLVFFLIISGIVYANYSTNYDFLISPLLNAGYSNTDLVAFTIYEGFQVKITNTFLVSFILSLPVLIIVIGNFIKPAINDLTNYSYAMYILSFLFLFYLGVYVAFQTLPIAIDFLLSFNESDFILRTQNYFQIVFRIAMLFGISFQIPLIIYFLIKKRIINKTIFTNNRKELFVVVLIFSAILTPTGDPLTLFAFTIPIYLLIEFVLFLNKNK